ncbi:MAG TPA: 7-cyano-7-deazaguanine synthase [Methanobacteriaceae archaeon]|nr:7-cyano-7-deazaguanine synthase [Methanobacteriaceae archaeon]HNS25115.1 7-cyano-7-deazaguanine synthase [Methanobacteriaceae archaeon]
MKAAVLYSGGKDSSLMAVILHRLGYQVELLTANFGVYPSYKPAKEAAKNLGFSHRVLRADKTLLENAVSRILEDGYPNQGIHYLHRQILEVAASGYGVVADGVRRDDRVPRLSHREVASFQDRHGVEYINLSGFGHRTVNNLGKNLFKLKKEPTNPHNNSDYEIEIRHLIREKKGIKIAESLFPPHTQSRVIGWRENESK